MHHILWYVMTALSRTGGAATWSLVLLLSAVYQYYDSEL
jgi:hypothetical protein